MVVLDQVVDQLGVFTLVFASPPLGVVANTGGSYDGQIAAHVIDETDKSMVEYFDFIHNAAFSSLKSSAAKSGATRASLGQFNCVQPQSL